MSKSLKTSDLSKKPRQTEITLSVLEENVETGEKKLLERVFTHKDYNKTKEAFTFRCKVRSCHVTIRVPLESNYKKEKIEKNIQYYALVTSNIEWSPVNKDILHNCIEGKPNIQKAQVVATLKKDPDEMKQYILSHTSHSALEIMMSLQGQGIKVSQKQVEDELRRIIKLKYPKDNYVAFSSEYCVRDDRRHNVFKHYSKIPRNPQPTTEDGEVAILASNFQLERLAESPEWFIDGTFWAAPKGFYQVVNILVYSEKLKKYLCCAHLFLPGKKQNEYNYAFTNLVQAAKMSNHKLNPKYIMTDHERSLKNALQEVFPKAKDLRCQFHFVQALWKNAGKKALKTRNNIANTSRLIIILTILVHLPEAIRKGYFEALKPAYPVEYQDFFNYFAKEWLNKEFLELTESNRKRQEKTNNCCESFHSYFKHLIGHAHPSPGFIVSKLKEYELKIRSDLVETFDKALNSKKTESHNEPNIPITKLTELSLKIKIKLEKEAKTFDEILANQRIEKIIFQIAEEVNELFNKVGVERLLTDEEKKFEEKESLEKEIRRVEDDEKAEVITNPKSESRKKRKEREESTEDFGEYKKLKKCKVTEKVN